MHNKGRNDGWCAEGFVPVSSNWDFNMDREGCAQGSCCKLVSQVRRSEEAPSASCSQQPETAAATRQNSAFPAMVAIELQPLDEVYSEGRALKAGTLFPVLHKPLDGYRPCDASCGTPQQAAAFAAWELRLYLRTHPEDAAALSRMRAMCREVNYATAFYTPESSQAPWPWEYEANVGAC